MQHQKITGKFIEVKSNYLHHEGTNDYNKDKLIIEDIVDKTGQKINPVWKKEWKEIAPGIETRGDSSDTDEQHVRIYRKACPVRIKFQQYHEYGTYDDHEHSSSDSRNYWVKYGINAKPPFKLRKALIYSFLFFVLYWLILEFGNADLNPDDTMWAVTGTEPRSWALLYYLCPIVSFICAALISGVVQTVSWAKAFPWRRIAVFITVFWVLDHSALFTNFSYWNLSFNWNPSPSFMGLLSFLLETIFSFHEFTAPTLSIMLTTFIVRKMDSFLLTTEQYLLESLSKEDFLILKNCLNRLSLNYQHLFSFCEDARVYNEMELCAEDKGFSSVEEAFTGQEISVIKKAEDLLSVAPVSVTEELRNFCHC
jgi:hypothetical protein